MASPVEPVTAISSLRRKDAASRPTLANYSYEQVLNVALPAAIVAAGAGCRVVKVRRASSEDRIARGA